MCSRDRKYFRFRYRVLFVALLLISSTALSAPKQDSQSPLRGLAKCAAIVSALIKDPNGLLKNPDGATIVLGCIQSFPLILEMMKHATKGPILAAGLVTMSGYFLYESNELYKRAKGLELNLEKYQDEFKLLQEELDIINDFIIKEVEPHGRSGSTAKIVKCLETLIEKMTSYLNRLKELADHIQKDILQGSDDKTRSWGYGAGGGIVCVSSLCTGNPFAIVPACSFGAFTAYRSYWSHASLEETLKQSELLKKGIRKMREEITKTRTVLEVLKMKVDINM